MSTTIVFVSVLVFAFLITPVLTRFTRHRTLGGVEFLLLGVLLGPWTVPRLLNSDVLAAVELFIAMLLGLVGFLTGLGLRRAFRDFEVGMAGVVSAFGVIFGVGVGVATALQAAFPEMLWDVEPVFYTPVMVIGGNLISLWLVPEIMWMSLAIAAAAGVTSATLLRRLAIDEGIVGNRIQLLEGLAIAGHAAAVLVLGVAMAGMRAGTSTNELGLTLIEWGVIVVGFGVLAGLLFSVYLGREKDNMRMTVAAIGAVTFAAGAGMALKVSPLFVALATGASVAMTSNHAEKLESALGPLNYPVSVLILLFAGAYWRPVDGWLWLMPLGYVALRAVSRRIATRIAVSTFISDSGYARGIGRGFVGQGVLAAAISLGFAQRFPEHAGIILTTVLGGMLLTDTVGRWSLRRFFADAGDIRPTGKGA